MKPCPTCGRAIGGKQHGRVRYTLTEKAQAYLREMREQEAQEAPHG